MVSGVLNFVYWNGKPAIVKEEEIDTIRKFLNEYEDVEVGSLVYALCMIAFYWVIVYWMDRRKVYIRV